MNPADIDMTVDIAGLTLSNPTLTASGTCGYGSEYAQYVDLTQLGAFTTKSITPLPRKGNRPERIVETPAGMLNAIGLANIGLERFVQEKIAELKELEIPVIVNVAGHSVDDYMAVCHKLDPIDTIAGVELNVSCPNVKDGMFFGTKPDLLRALVDTIKRDLHNTVLIVKLTPNVTDICEMARAAIDGGADALSMTNTFQGMTVNVDSWQPMLANNQGGLSGPAIKPLALSLINEVYQRVTRHTSVPIIGMGGIRTWQDAVEFSLVGARAFAVGTALFVDPGTPLKIVDGLRTYLSKRGLSRFVDLVGQVRLHDV